MGEEEYAKNYYQKELEGEDLEKFKHQRDIEKEHLNHIKLIDKMEKNNEFVKFIL